MTDKEQSGIVALGVANELSRTFTNLRDTSRRGLEQIGMHGLNGVDDQHPWTLGVRLRHNLLDLSLRQQT